MLVEWEFFAKNGIRKENVDSAAYKIRPEQ